MCISLSGVWNWRGTNRQGGKCALGDWDVIALNGRELLVAFDSDATANPEVRLALTRLLSFLEARRARPRAVILPAGPDGAKVGLDDFLAHHTREELLALAATAARPLSAARPATPPPPRATFPPCSLAEVEQQFARWIPDDDLIPTRAMLACYAANRHLTGDPVWLLLIGGSGIGKTERLSPLAVMPDVMLESSITGPAALLSGTAQKERALEATGGLLRKLPAAGGVLVLKDFTSIIDMQRDARAELLAALREIHDGRWDRSIGAEGGRTLSWTGRLGLIAGCTTAIDSAHAVMATMGMRFVLVRLTPNPKIAQSAFAQVGGERTMRDAVRTAVGGLLDHLPGRPLNKHDAKDGLIALGSYVALARSPVDRDSRSDIRLVLDPEAPTRVLKMLVSLWQACGLLGLDQASAWAIVQRVGLDSIPKLRRAVLDHLACAAAACDTSAVAEAVEHPTQTTRRALEDLAAHHVIRRTVQGPGRADLWQLADQTRDWLAELARTFPVLSEPPASKRTDTPRAAGDPPGDRVSTDKTGTVAAAEPAPQDDEEFVL